MKLAAFAVVLALAVVASGCGDDDGASSSSGDVGPITTSSLSKAEYLERANAICTRNEEKQLSRSSAYTADNPGQSEEELLEGATDAVYVPTAEERIEELRGLGAPKGEEKQLEGVVTAYEDAIEAAEENGATSQEFAKASTRSRNLAQKAGLTECDL